MLEKLGAWMLKLYLGDYLELNTDQLSVGILSGQVELEDIPIKHDAFENFDLPIRVRSGRVGKISLSIPVAEMKSQPWVINISDVHVIVEPNTNTKYDEKAHKKRAQLNKTRMLEELENNWKLERQPEAPTSYYGSWWNYGSGIASNIMENLQLNLSDLHLRYESGKEGPVSNYSFGLIIKKLVAQSTDSNWVPQYVSGSKNPIVHKQIELVGLSLYWDYNTECLSTAASLKKRSLKLTHDCLLAPVSGKALVQRNTTAQPLRSQNQPRLKLELQFDNFMLSLNDKQYGGIASLLRELDYYEKRKLYRRTRPYEPVCKNCKAWWRHAIESELLVIRDKNERTSKEYLLKRARNCVSYVYLYYEHLAEKLTGQQSKLKEKIEADMDFETLKTLRMLAVAKIKDAGKWEMVPAQPNPGYLSSWVTWYTSKPSDTLHTSDGSKSLPDVESLSKATPSSSMTSLSSSDARSSHALRLTSKERATLEEELNDWVGKSEPAETRSTLNRDSVFLHLTFVLHHAKFLLRNSATGGDKSQGLVQLECHDICSAAVIRPRSKSAKFSLKLGGLYVKDLYNTDTQFPLLISPRLSQDSVSKVSGALKTNPHRVGALSSQKLTEQSELFYFEIEKNPSHSEKDIKVHMRTQPLDVIYNEGVVGQVRQFFSPHKGLQSMSKEMSEAHLAERARKRYEQLKNKTKIDIQDTWENLLNTSTVKLSKRVGVRLDISAPQFIVPKDLLDGDTNMMVFDLGKLKVTNLDSQDEDDQPTFSLDPGGQEAQEDDLDIMDDDDFVTPPSTPPEPSESVSEKGLLSSASKEENMSGDEIYSHMYDRYRVLLADIQVLVVSRKDNWRLSTQRGLSHFHIIDKLSVNFRFERRLLLTADPEWPAIRVSAVMDRLSIHISPLKLMQLQRCIEKLTAQSDDIPHSTSQSSSAESLLTSSTGQARLAHSQSRSFAPLETRSVLDNSKVVKCNLDINQMSLDIHNKERCLVELQVAGVQTEFTKLPSETDLSLTVHSFIVADAIQSYGSDFELLVASHKNVRLDSQSGSMCSSMLTSPTSPRSPPSPRSPSSPEPEHVHSSARRQTSYTSFQNAVLSGIQNLLPVASATPIAEHSTGLKAHSVSSADNQAASSLFLGEPLIKVNYICKSSGTNEGSSRSSLDVVFNSLDLVANQETIVELLAFFNEVMPQGSLAVMSKGGSNVSETEDAQPSLSSTDNKAGEEMVVQAEFRKLNVLLHRPDVPQSGSRSELARSETSVIKVAIINMTGARIEAALSNGTLYTVEAELGGLQIADLSPGSLHTHVFAFGNMNSDQISLMDQTIPAHMYQTCIGDLTALEEKKAFHMMYKKACDVPGKDNVKLGIGSIQYIHVPRFLSDLYRSVSLFHEYIENAKQRIRHAASEVAEFFVKPNTNNATPAPLCDMELDVTLDAPLLVLPCSDRSTQVLVAELGRMVISNATELSDSPTRYTARDIIDIRIRDIKLVAKEVDPPKIDTFTQEVIVEEAGINLTIIHNQILENQTETSSDGGDFHLELSGEEFAENTCRKAVSLSAEVPHPLQVSLSRQAYDLLLQAVQTASSTNDSGSDPMKMHAGKGQESTTSHLSSNSADAMLYVSAALTVPIVSVAIKDQLGGTETEGIIKLQLEELSLAYEKKNPYIASLKLQLSSLSALDLLQPEDSKHRYLALSLNKSHQREAMPKFVSTSLPGTLIKSRKRKLYDHDFSVSHPLSISSHCIKPVWMETDNISPATPPSTPRNEQAMPVDDSVGNLVTVTITLIDKSIPSFSTQHGSINTEVDIDFNSLELVVNQETWVMVLDFFGLGAKVFTPEEQHEVNTVLRSQPPTEGMKAKLSVKSFSVVFVKKCYDLARANINNIQVDIIKQQQATRFSGVLGSLCLDDLSPHGCLHSCKFTTQAGSSSADSTDSSALKFNVFKHDVPDEMLERDFDISVDLQMSSVIYTFTKRFPIEILNFLQDFLDYHDSIGHMRAAAVGQQLPDGPGHSARLKLNIRAGTPIIILPGSSLSEEVIVMHLGNLSVTNQFLWAGSEGTLDYGKEKKTKPQSGSAEYSYDPMTSSLYCAPGQSLEAAVEHKSQSCLLDVMSVRLTDMDLYSARRIEGASIPVSDLENDSDILLKDYYFVMDRNHPLKERCVLDLIVERNLDNDLNHSSPEMAVKGALSSVYCHLDVEQYKLVRAVLDQNLGEELQDLQRVAKQLPHIQTILSGNVWTGLDISINLHNVTIELLHEHATLVKPAVSLARLDFITSKLAFVSYSNQSKDIDLVSQEIRVTDTRASENPVFKNILQATHELQPTVLHMELHMMSSKERSCASALFNNVRIFCVVDWLFALKEYLASNAEKKALTEVPRVSQAVAHSLLTDVVETPAQTPKLELKMNLTDTELVLVDDLSSYSSNAIILKTTAVSHYVPSQDHRLLTCNLQKMELFSCCLSDEGNTALSIIDPFDVSIELLKSKTVHENVLARRLEVHLSEMCVKFSYNDLLLFKRILQSLPSQLQSAITTESQDSHEEQRIEQGEEKPDSTSLAITSVDLSCDGLSVCLINDSADMDVPLFDLKITEFRVDQALSALSNETAREEGHVTFKDPVTGSLTFCMALNYYNRMLSGWEPLVEPWHLKASWTGNPLADDNLTVKAAALEVVNLNMTSALLDMLRSTQDLFNSLADKRSSNHPITSRESFVPYSLHNQTDRTLLFAIVTKANGTTSLPTSWTEVLAGQTKAFSFMSYQLKQRHQSTHKSTNYKLVVMVEGWQKTCPISIDKVGQFFRTVQTDPHCKAYQQKVVASRIVFDIVCMENASKCITVKSPVTLVNKTFYTMEARLESLVDRGASHVMTLPSGSSQSLPLAFMFSQMWFRPAGDEMLTYTDFAVSCQNSTMKAGETKSVPLTCNSVLDRSQSYRLSAVIRHEYYPYDAVMETLGDETLFQPGHTISLLSPLTLVNLLPVDLGYLINGSGHTGKLKPGEETALHQIDASAYMKIDFAADGYHKGGVLHINSSTSDHLINVRLYDNSDRLLLLEAKVTRLALGSVKVAISVKYWLINHTGLPLVFRQVGIKGTSAGQYEEHELARSLAPLMFSFSDREHPDLCSMRLGNTVHTASTPSWSSRFSIDKGNHVRRLRVTPDDGRPDWVYNIGVEVKRGSGKYQDTNMAIMVPYNKIINKSSHRIAFTQKHFTQKNEIYQASLPGSSQAYHWPRHDLDPLLCIKILDLPNMLWSGAFRIDQLNSFVINHRCSDSGEYRLMKVETVLLGSTFTTIVADASDIPPPLRIENYTDLSIKYWQTEVAQDKFTTIVKPKSSLAYAWDEPTLAQTLTCAVQCGMGSAEKTYDMNTLGQATNLVYENLFYILLTGSTENLVLDVVGVNNVVFSHREPGRRSQLWSQSAEGQLIHEGTSSASVQPPHGSSKYCLDIAELAVVVEGCSCLALRKVDSRRRTTQIWSFLEDGRLVCRSKLQCVQSLAAFGGMQPGARVALGPFDNKQLPSIGSMMSMAKMLPGSGVLSVNVETDGPTRVLRLADANELESMKDVRLNSVSQLSTNNEPSRQIQVTITVPSIGLSVVNHVREELFYLTLSYVKLKLEQNSKLQTVFLTVKELQMDNQLMNNTCPLILYASPSKSRQSATQRCTSALEVEWQHVLGVKSSMHVFKLLSAQLAPFSLDIDELLLFKLVEMFGSGNKSADELDIGRMQLPQEENIDVNVRKFYFALLMVTCGQLTLSVHTTSLPKHLKELKKSKAMSPMMNFENAVLDFEPFLQMHPFESFNFLLGAIGTHFKQELQRQAAKIVGAVDLLGNPLGLVNDVTTGISGLVTDGNVGMLLKNVTHGASNSIAKVTGTLSKGLGWMTMDDQHEDSRELIRRQYTGSNVLLGVRSLGHGMLGGLTSIVQQTAEGTSQKGFEGFVTGLSKGVVGTFTKPLVGVLDFASGAATALRDTSGGGAGPPPTKKKREPRCCYGKDGLLPVYSSSSAQGQGVVTFLNGEKQAFERYVGHIRLSSQKEAYSLLTSDQGIYVLKMMHVQDEVQLHAKLTDVLSCTYVRREKPDRMIQHYVEFKVRQLSESGGHHYKQRNPQFGCDSAYIAEQAVLLVDHARSIYDEMLHTVPLTKSYLD